MISERSSPSRVRCAAPGGAPLTAAGRSEPAFPAKRERLRPKRLELGSPHATEVPITIGSLQEEVNLTKRLSGGGEKSEALHEGVGSSGRMTEATGKRRTSMRATDKPFVWFAGWEQDERRGW